MKKKYSIDNAKSRLREIVRLVTQGQSVVITDGGMPVACVTGIDQSGGLDARIRMLEKRGEILGYPLADPRRIRTIARRRGAVSRFLQSRNRSF